MSIADQNTVLILGAGSSEPFSMPLGGELVSGIARQLRKEHTETLADDNFGNKFVAWQRVMEWGSRASSWHVHPIHGTVVGSLMDKQGALSEQDVRSACEKLRSLYNLLNNQTAETIDAFIAENPVAAPLAKLAIGALMVRAMYTPKPDDKNVLTVKSFDARDLDVTHRGGDARRRERNWIHLLINIVRHAIDEGQITPDNKIKIITFNYDTILEYVLDKQFSNREAPLGSYRDYIEVHHVHGMFGELVDSVREPWLLSHDWGQKICVVKEAKPLEAVAAARSRAVQIIAEATHVYSVGFSFAGPNCRLLRLTDAHPTGERSLTYCNYVGNRGIAESAKRYVAGAGVHQEVAGDFTRPISISDFIQSGYLGEPPG